MNENRELTSLTGIRFLVAALVVWFHYGHNFVMQLNSSLLAHFVNCGWSGVGFFFTLSGFILYHACCVSSSKQAQSGKISVRDFWLRRIARVYPLYLASVLFFVPSFVAQFVEDHSLPETVVRLLTHAFLLQAWTHTFGDLNFPSWSLSVEAFFYLLFPWLFLWSRKLSAQKSLLLFAVLLVVAAVPPLVYVLADPELIGPNISPHHRLPGIEFVKFFPPFHLPTCLMGMLAAHILHKGYIATRLWTIGGIVSACALVPLLTFSDGLPFLFPFLHNGLLVPLYCLLVGWLACRESFVQRALGSRIFRILGESSYALYLLQMPIYVLALNLGLRSLPHEHKFPIYFVLLVGASVLTHFGFERPMRKAVLFLAKRCQHSSKDAQAPTTTELEKAS